MAYDKDIEDADAYFDVDAHVKALDWANYTDNEKTAALVQAKRELELFLCRDLYNPASTDRYRDDYAHFEQALYLLEETVRTTNSQNSAQIIETADTEQRDKFYGITICPIAQKYLLQQRIRISRGS
jgi:hypothetical protein